MITGPLSLQRIIECLNSAYGLDVASLSRLSCGADLDASIYQAHTHDRLAYFIKLKRGHHHDISVTLLSLLHDAGIQHIIPPVKTKQGQPTEPIDDFTLIVYPFVEGQNGFSQQLTDDQWPALGSLLRQVHELQLPPSIQCRMRREDYSTKWRAAVRSLYPLFDTAQPVDENALKLLTFIHAHRTEIQRLVDRAEQLSQEIQKQSPEFVLCHSDIHGGNVLIDRNHKIYIVDWDEPIMAPKERDLMFIGGGVANVWNYPREEEIFYQGYGKTIINRTILSYYRHERIVEDIAIYAQELLLPATDHVDRSEMLQQFIDMFNPRGVVEIAFKTDAK